jgi:spermidine synthase
VVAVFLIGIAGGSLVFVRRGHRPPQLSTLGGCLAAAALLALVPLIVSNVTGPPGLPLVVPLILPVTGLLGFAFPLTVRLFTDSAALASRGVGLVYAANTVGCVIGTVLAGFVLIPTIGASASIIILCLAQAVLGGALAVRYAPRPRVPVRLATFRLALRAGLAVAVAGVLVGMLFVPVARLTYIQRQLASSTAPKAHFEDDAATVDVVGGPPLARQLLVNGKGITKLTVATKLLAYIPKALRPNASTMLNICFGMGTTYRSSIILGLHTTAVELDPTVPKVMSWFYPDANRYLHSPLGHIVINDGRNYVRLSNKRYDLITIDAPPPVWGAGTVVLMTREFYAEALQRLAPGGVLTSFVPYSGETLQKVLLRTFRASFRYMTVIRGLKPFGMYLIGSQAPLVFTGGAIRHVFGSPAARADLDSAPDFRPVPVSAWPSIIRSHIWMTGDQVNAYTGSGPLLTDDHPLSEYFLIQSFGVGFEQPALHLALVVTGLLALLIIGLAADGLWRRRVRPLAAPPGTA